MKKSPMMLLLICLLSLSGLAQQADSPKPQVSPMVEPQQPARPDDDNDVVKITTNLVQVDAVITDKKGKVVTDLRPEEIQILENGRSQKITHFSFVSTEARLAPEPTPAAKIDRNAPPGPPTRLRPEDVRRTIALVVDDLGLSFESTHYVREALKKFVDRQMQPGDLVAIIRTRGGMGALQQFTSDKRQLYAAIDRVKWSLIIGRVGAFAPIQDSSRMSEAAAAADEDLNQTREDIFAVGTLGAVNYVVRGMRDLPGRKSILLISEGFRIYSRGDPTRSYRALQSLQRLVDRANRASVVIYTMNAVGLQTLGLTAADSTGEMTLDQVEQQLANRRNLAFESQEGLDYLARQTGGVSIRNTNDLSGGIRRVLEEQGSYYLIGYRPDQATFDPTTGRRKFHKLSLKITRPGKFNVRMRNGFYGVSDEDNAPVANTPRQQIINALVSPFGTAGIHLKLTSLFANDPKVGSYMRSLLHVDTNDMLFTPQPDGWQKAEFDVVALTFGDNGILVDEVARSYRMRIPNDEFMRMKKNGFVYFLTVPVKKSGAYQLRVALRDSGSQHVGSASQFIEIPDIKKNRLTISGILVSIARPALTKTGEASPAPSPGNQSGGSAAAEYDVDTTTSAASRRFKRGEVLQYTYVIYNAKPDKTTRQPQLQTQLRLIYNGQPVFTGKEILLSTADQTDVRRLAVTGGLQLGMQLEPGEYVLQFVVTDLLADGKHRVATQWIDFELSR